MATTSEDVERLLTVKDLAARLAVPPSWVYLKVETGELPFVRLGRYVRFEPAAVEELLRKQRRGS